MAEDVPPQGDDKPLRGSKRWGHVKNNTSALTRFAAAGPAGTAGEEPGGPPDVEDDHQWADDAPPLSETDGGIRQGTPPERWRGAVNRLATLSALDHISEEQSEPDPMDLHRQNAKLAQLKAREELREQMAALRQNSAPLALLEATQRLRQPTLAAAVTSKRGADTWNADRVHIAAIKKVRDAAERIDQGVSEPKAVRRARRRLRDGNHLPWDARVKPERRRLDVDAVMREVGRTIRVAGRQPWFQTRDPDQDPDRAQALSSGDGGMVGVVYGVDLYIGKSQSASGGVLSITLFGESGDSGAHQLVKEWHGPPAKGHPKMFTVDCATELGELTKLGIEYRPPGKGERLFLQKVVVLHPSLPDAHFACNWWAAEHGVSRREIHRDGWDADAFRIDIPPPSARPQLSQQFESRRARPRPRTKRASDTFAAFQEA
jgi:hypothetical protein